MIWDWTFGALLSLLCCQLAPGQFSPTPLHTTSEVAPARESDANGWWPQFRGPQGTGIANDCWALPTRMSATENVAWNVAVPGTGWSSPVTDGELIWLTTAIRVPESNVDGTTSPGLDLAVLAFERKTGAVRYSVKLFHLEQPDLIHSLNSYASPTPCLDQDHVYCHFGTYGTAAVNRTDGKIVWTNQETQLKHSTGPGSSPILHHDLLIFHADGTDTQAIVALDRQTGSIRWRTERSGDLSPEPEQKKSFSTPLIAVIGQETLLISPAANWLYVYDPNTGKERLKVPYGETGYSVVPRPIVLGKHAYVCTGFDRSRLLCVDIDPQENTAAGNRILWSVDQRMPTMPSPVLVDERLYLISDAGIATCVDTQSGEVVWSERLGGKFAASPIHADGKIYVGNQSGELFVLRPDRELNILASNPLDSAIMASPIAIGNQLIVRTAERLYLFEKR